MMPISPAAPVRRSSQFPSPWLARAGAADGRPLAWQLGALCAALLLPMLVLGGFLLLRMADAERALHEAGARDAARRIAVTLDRGLTTYQAVLEVLATSDHLHAGRLDAFLRRALEVPRPAGSQIVLRDAAGRILADTTPPGLAGRTLPPRPDAEAARHTAVTGQPQVSDRLGPATCPDDTRSCFALVAPVRGPDAAVVDLLALVVPTGVLGQLLRREDVPEGMVASLFDRRGALVARSATGPAAPDALPSAEQEAEDGWLRLTAADGAPLVAATARSALSGWTAMVSLPEDAFAAPLRRSLVATLGFGLLLAGLAAALAHAFARRIARPIEALAGAATERRGAVPVTAVREVNAVARALGAAQEEARRRAAEREALLASLDLAQVLVRAPGGAITLWTSGMERLLGWTRAEALGQVSHALLRTEFPQPLPEIEAALLARGEWRGELRHRCRGDGAVVVCASHWALRRGPDGEALAVVEAHTDITALRGAEAELRRSRDLLSSVLEGSGDPIFAKDRAGRFVVLNPPAAAVLGTTVEAAIGRRAAALVDPALAARLDAADREVMETGLPRTTEEEVVLPRLGRRVLLTTKAPWCDATGAPIGVVGVARDITARRAAEARLRETQAELFRVARLNAMGAMAAALAHELNQPLTAAANYAEAARLLLPEEHAPGPEAAAAVREAVAEAAAEAVRAGRIVQRLRAFIGRGDTEKRPSDVNAIVETAVSLGLAGTAAWDLSLRLVLDPAAPPVLADAVQLQQVLVNLMRNAAEAMRGMPRRELTVATATLADGGVEVSVADTGPGLAPELEGRLFEPFATTKPEGMGVGLAISRSIVEGHGGRLEAAPRAGGGTVFRFVLPAPAAGSRPGQEAADAA